MDSERHRQRLGDVATFASDSRGADGRVAAFDCRSPLSESFPGGLRGGGVREYRGDAGAGC